jgi:cytochrome d ubiquinol oxidase subunit II
MGLPALWFWLIAFLWAGYFLLEGFDFGVGMLLPFLPRRGSEQERSLMFEAIGPVWDGNEVWLVVAAGATFAAFPVWYATMFSGFYIALILILVLLIVRVVSFEWRSKADTPAWRAAWTWANTIGSAGATFLWGLTLANLLHGVPLTHGHVFFGSFLDLFSGFTVLAGLAVVCVFTLHGAVYLALRTEGDFRERAARTARLLAPLVAIVAAGFLAWSVVVAHQRNDRTVLPVLVPAAVTVAALVLAVVLSRFRREGWAFATTGLAAIGIVATIFVGLYPRVLVSHPNFANSLTTANAVSGHYELKVITVVAVIFAPLVILYQGWTYHVFRKRLGAQRSGRVVSG